MDASNAMLEAGTNNRTICREQRARTSARRNCEQIVRRVSEGKRLCGWNTRNGQSSKRGPETLPLADASG